MTNNNDMAELPPAPPLQIAGQEHPLRATVLAEVHARPYEILQGPLRVSHLALVTGPDGTLAQTEHSHLEELCGAHGVQPPAPGVSHFSQDLGPFRLRWERHQEFSTYTFFCPGAESEPFKEPAITLLPTEWLARLPGQLLAATHLVLEQQGAAPRTLQTLEQCFMADSLAGSEVARGAARAFTDFRLHADGFTRMLVEDRSLAPRRAGRLVQRLLEIETYRLMALLAFPLARQISPEMARLEQALESLTSRMIESRRLDDDQALLQSLSELAARVEQLMAQSSFRLSAAQAYDRLIEQRIERLREQRIHDLQTMGNFLERRLAPAMRTCASVAQRLEALARRVSRTANLLRTRVDVALEAQNRDLLSAMNRRTQLQLRLQETVEGLSVVVLSYYVIGLLAYVAKGTNAAGFLRLPVDLGLGLAVPIVVGGIWVAMRILRRRQARSG
ncbi:MAG TPA: DUF3422 domain-containing protein [Gammaproteobacteria bacterium]|nr:DUF3422 domain-containing protein [Gammaproteobacteria bacterium]